MSELIVTILMGVEAIVTYFRINKIWRDRTVTTECFHYNNQPRELSSVHIVCQWQAQFTVIVFSQL